MLLCTMKFYTEYHVIIIMKLNDQYYIAFLFYTNRNLNINPLKI